MSERGTIRFGPFELDLQCGELRKDGNHLKLQGQPIQILELLLSKRGELVSREEIRQRLWSGDTFVDFEHSLNTAIKKLRQALGDEAVEPRYIETLPKRGYRFVAEVERPTTDFAPQEFVAGVMQGLEPQQAKMPAQHRIHLRLHLGPSLAALLLLLVAATVATRYFMSIPMPRIVATHVLTHTGYPKSNLVTDGRMLYFIEQRPEGPTVMTLPMTGGEPREVAMVPGLAGFSVSNDGSQLLMNVVNRREDRWDTWILPLPGGSRRLIIKDAQASTWTPDGQYIIFVRDADGATSFLYRARADGTDTRELGRIPRLGQRQLVISPDGRRIYFQQPTGVDWEAGTDGTDPHPIPSIKRGAGLGAWSSNGEYYFFNAPGPELNQPVLHVLGRDRNWWGKSRVRSALLSPVPITVGTPTVSNDGGKIFVDTVLRRGELAVLDEKSGRFLPYALPISACYTDFSPDGQWIAYVSYPDAVLWRSRIDGTDRMQLTSPPILPLNPRWSPDGKLILFSEMPTEAFTKSNIYAVSIEGGEPLLVVAGTPFAIDGTWSPDGSEIAYSEGKDLYANQNIRVLDLKSRNSVELPGSKGLYSPRWSPDGKYILALSFPATRLMLYDFSIGEWRQIASGIWFAWPNWSHDSTYVQLGEARGQIVRVNVTTSHKEVVVDASAVAQVNFYFDHWFGATPDGRPITTRDIGTHEIYAFDLEYK